MPVRIPAGLYSGGAFKVDVSPLLQVIKQRQAEKKAARDAAAKYFSGLKDKINTAGVRSVDLEGGLQGKIDNWVNQGVSNLDKISKGGQSYSDFVKGYQGILGDIEKSKNRAKFETDLGKAQFEGKYDPDADDLHVISKVGKSIYDPESYKQDGISEYTYGDIPSNVPPFDPNKQTQFFTATFGKSKPTYDESRSRVDNVTGTVFVPKEYNDESVKEIAENAKNVFYGDRSAQKHYKNQLGNESWMKDANKAYQSIYGDKYMVDSPEKAAQADAIMRARLSGEEIEVKDPTYAEAMRKRIIDYGAKKQKEVNAARQSHASKNPSATIGSYYSGNASTMTDEDGNKIKIVNYDDIVTEQDIKAIISSKITPFKDANNKKYYKINNDGTWEGKNGTVPPRILNIKLQDYKTSQAPSKPVDIWQFPENIQKGIMAFSQKNNLPLSDALSILKEQRPEIFS